MYDDDPILSSCGIEIDKQLTRVDARVLSAPTVSLFCLFFSLSHFRIWVMFFNCLDWYAIQLVVGNSEDCIPNRGRWNYNNKVVTTLLVREHIYLRTLCWTSPFFSLLQRLLDPVKIERWAIVNFSARCDMSRISRELINCGRSKGIVSILWYFVFLHGLRDGMAMDHLKFST